MTGKIPMMTVDSQFLNDTAVLTTINNIGNVQVVLYTVPANKKARIIGFIGSIASLGANTIIQIRINSVAILQFAVTGNIAGGLLTGLALNAGDTVNILGNSGANNGVLGQCLTVKELPVMGQ